MKCEGVKSKEKKIKSKTPSLKIIGSLIKINEAGLRAKCVCLNHSPNN